MSEQETIEGLVGEIMSYGYWVSIQCVPVDDPVLPNTPVSVSVLTSPDKAGGQRSILSPFPQGKTVLDALTNATQRLKGEIA